MGGIEGWPNNICVYSGEVHIMSGFINIGSGIIDVMLTDLSGNTAAISKRHEGLVVTKDITREVHKGEMYHVSVCRSGLAADGTLDMLIFPASGKELHCTFGIDTAGAGESALYENIAFDTSGTPVTIPNMNRVCSGQPDTLVTIDPTNCSGGNVLWCEIQGGPGGKFGGGGPGTTRSELEWILNGVSGVIPYLLRVTNTEATDAKAAHLSITFSEEDPTFWFNG